MKDLYSAV